MSKSKKKLSKITLLCILCICIFTMIVSVALAAPSDFTSSTSVLDSNTKNQINSIGKTVFDVVNLIGNIAAVVLLAIFGIQWMSSGDNPSKRTSLKDKAIYYVGGAGVLFAAPKIANWIYNIFSKLG